MNNFRRVFKYIRPQWPQIITVVLAAIIVSSLLSLSFVTVIPLLKVMMGEEGLHGWVERKICAHWHGINFSLPEITNFNATDVPSHLLVTNIKQDSPAQKAGLQKMDMIVGAGDLLVGRQDQQIPRTKLLEALATAPANKDITIQVRRFTDEGSSDLTLTFNAGPKPFYADRLENLLSFLPRQQSAENKTKAVIFIVGAMCIVTIIRCWAKYYQEYIAQKIVQIGINHLREDAFGHAMDMPIGFFANDRPSDIVSRIIGDTNVMAKAIKIMLGKALREPMNALFMVAVAMWLNWQLTLVFLCGAPFVLWFVFSFGKKMKNATKKSLVASSQMLAKLQEAVAGLKVVKIYNREESEKKSFVAINKNLLKQLLKISRVDSATMPVMEVLGMAAGSAALIVGRTGLQQARWM